MTRVLIVHNCWVRSQAISAYLEKTTAFVKENAVACRIIGPVDFVNRGLPMSLSVFLQSFTLRSTDDFLWFIDNGTTDLRSLFHRFKGPKTYDYTPGPWLLKPYGRELARKSNYLVAHSKLSLEKLNVDAYVPKTVIPYWYGLDLFPMGKSEPETSNSLTGVIFVPRNARSVDFAISSLRRNLERSRHHLVAVAQDESVVPYLEGLRSFWGLKDKIAIKTLRCDDPDYAHKMRSIFADCDFYVSASEDDEYYEFLQSQLYQIPSLVTVKGYCSEFAGTSTIQFEAGSRDDFGRALKQLTENTQMYAGFARNDRSSLLRSFDLWESQLKEFIRETLRTHEQRHGANQRRNS